MNSPTHKTFWVATAVGSCVLSATLTGLLAPQAQAGDPLPGGITLRASMKVFSGFDGEWLNTGFDNPVNPGNQVLKLPAFTWLEDLRPVVKIESEAGISGVAKPRLLVTGNSVSQQLLPSVDKSTSYNQNINYEWMELYAKWQVNENVTVSVGTQNIQWGPGELFSPSNEIFPFFLQNNTPLFYLRGRQLFQASWTPSKDSSLMLLSEYDKNKDPDFQAGRAFYKKALIKGETNFTTGDGANTHTVSLIAGTDEARSSWLGEYANFSLSDSTSLYFDASENFKKTAYYPNSLVTPGSVVLANPETSVNGFFPRVLAGGRYTFPKGTEFRLEYFYNGLGWTRDQYSTAISSLSDPLYGATNLPSFLAPGLDFRGQHYVYTSLRIGDLGHKDKATYFLRYLHNLTDQSGSLIASVEYTPADRWSVLVAVLAERGGPNTELSQIQNGELQAALRLDF